MLAKITPLPSTGSDTLGDRLKAEMKKRGVRSAELAKRANVKRSFLYDIMSGKSAHPSPTMLARVADALDINLDWLVGSPSAPKIDAALSMADEYTRIPYLDGDDDNEPCRFRRDWIASRFGAEKNLRLLQVRGDGMEPILARGDMVLVDITKTNPSPAGLFAVSDGLATIVKRLEYLPGEKRVRVMSDNAKYASYERSVKEAAISGRVVWLAREI